MSKYSARWYASVSLGDGTYKVTVEPSAAGDALELDHLEAISFLGGIFSQKRGALPVAIRSWFPLPLFVDTADHV